MSDRLHRNLLNVLSIPEDSQGDLLLARHVLDDGGNVEVAPVPDNMVTNLSKKDEV